MTNLYQWDACGRAFSDAILPLSIQVLVVARRSSETMAQCFFCHSISVFRFDVHHRRRCTLTHVCLSKYRVHFQCETFKFRKSIFGEFIAPSAEFIVPYLLFKTTNGGAPKKHRGYPDRCPSGGLAARRTFYFIGQCFIGYDIT